MHSATLDTLETLETSKTKYDWFGIDMIPPHLRTIFTTYWYNATCTRWPVSCILSSMIILGSMVNNG